MISRPGIYIVVAALTIAADNWREAEASPVMLESM